MMMIGVDYHPSFQEIAFFVEETGEYGEQRLNHDGREAEQFYRDLKQRGISDSAKIPRRSDQDWYRAWAIPCGGTQVYALCHRSVWLSKISEAGVRRRG